MLEWLGKWFRYKRVDLEANLRPTPECTFGGSGEVEVEVWSDGTASLEAKLKNSGVPPGSDLEVVCTGKSVGSLPVAAGGYSKLVLNFTEQRQPPQIAAGDTAELRLDGKVLYRGTFRRD